MSGIIGRIGSGSGVLGITEIDYEEGTWTPLLNGNNDGLSGEYTKVGRLVRAFAYIWANTTSNRANCQLSGLPYASNRNCHFILNRIRGGDSDFHYGIVNDGGTTVGMMNPGTTTWSNYVAAHANWQWDAGGSSIACWDFVYTTYNTG